MELELVRHLARSALQNLEAHRRRIDDLNVYPVPDGDTGTNLVLTLRSVVEALEASTAADSEAVAHDVTRAALMGARGNSGVIFSQVVRGFVEVLGEHERVSSPLLARAFRGASDSAYRAVKRPVEGTMLTVIREMAEEGERDGNKRLRPPEFLRAVLTRGEDALARTPELLDVLRNAGVVDAGGAGLVEIARGMVHGATGEPIPDISTEAEPLAFEAIHLELSEYRYCTGFVVEGEELDKDALESQLEQIGDSLLVVGDSTALKVHVHTNDPGQALAIGTAVGVVEGVEIARGMVHGATGEPIPDISTEAEPLGFEAIHLELSEYRYCTGFVVEGEELDKDALESQLEQIGDSLLVVGDSTALKVHVHTNDPGQALAIGTAVGVVEGVEIANMHHQTAQREERLLEGATAAVPTLETGLVAVCPGQGNRRLFEGLGATRVIEGGQSMNPSAAEILDAIEAVPTDDVLVLPNNSNVILTAEQAAGLSTKRVRVIPSSSVQAGFAAMSRFLPTASVEENEREMSAELAEAATGEITIASRDANLDGIDIEEGAYLGLVAGRAIASGQDLDFVVNEVVDRVVADGKSVLTILTGEGAPALDGLLPALEARHSDLEFIDVHEGGQPHYPLLVVAQ